MKPFYEDEYITIYHGDCLEILPTLAGVRSIVSDPPYGINLNAKYKSRGRGQHCESKDYPPVIGDDKPFNPAHLLGFQNVILWGANYYADSLPVMSSWLIWDKREGMNPNDNADCEIAWSNLGSVPRLYSHLWNGRIKKGADRLLVRQHPTQKPVSLMRWCIQQIKDPGLICDPYAGSGSTLVAAKELGLKTIGIELVEEYCEIAAKRVQGVTIMHPAFTRQSNNALAADPLQLGLTPQG